MDRLLVISAIINILAIELRNMLLEVFIKKCHLACSYQDFEVNVHAGRIIIIALKSVSRTQPIFYSFVCSGVQVYS